MRGHTSTRNKEAVCGFCLRVSGLILSGSLGTRSSSSLLALPGEWQGGHTVRREECAERGNGPEAFSAEMEKYPHLPQRATRNRPGTRHEMRTHAHRRQSHSDGQFCHQRLPSRQSDRERLGPYIRLCSPKRCLGAGVTEMPQSLLVKGHNQM